VGKRGDAGTDRRDAADRDDRVRRPRTRGSVGRGRREKHRGSGPGQQNSRNDVEKDRCHEDSHRLLMLCYDRLGLRARALRQYRLCEEALGQDYGLSPSPETRVVYRNITMGQPIADL
jgi:hypothetical protein